MEHKMFHQVVLGIVLDHTYYNMGIESLNSIVLIINNNANEFKFCSKEEDW